GGAGRAVGVEGVSDIFFCEAGSFLTSSWSARDAANARPRRSSGRFVSSHWRTSLRKASCSGVKSKSIKLSYLFIWSPRHWRDLEFARLQARDPSPNRPPARTAAPPRGSARTISESALASGRGAPSPRNSGFGSHYHEIIGSPRHWRGPARSRGSARTTT